ncbi:ROK family protein [Herbidospora daliensis]|uniref:ROK family protein n=1 Tax=Herbidospora daliensis TaxID=295585 RepID=UPI000780CDE8|nr:ROK family protein [Herbidospora daliensis]
MKNLGALLRHIHLNGPTSRAALTEEFGLNRSTTMALTAELAALGLVREELPDDVQKAGRPSLVVSPESEKVFVLAFDVAVDWLVAARVGLGGVILDRRAAVRQRRFPDLDDVVGTLAEFARQLLRDVPDGAVCVGVGASFCGMIRPHDGTVRYGPKTGWVDQAFGPELERRLPLDLPVRVGNEAHLGAVAENERGAGIGFRNLIYLHGDVGVGGGVIVDGKRLGGDDGYAAEAGHMVVNPFDGRPCLCGSRGCLEAEVGESALLDLAGWPHGSVGRDAVASVVHAAERGDQTAREALNRVGDWLGVGVANLINLFNPGVVVFGGMLRDVYRGSAEQVRDRIEANVLPVSRERVELRIAALGDDTTLVGGAELGFAGLLDDPAEAVRGAHRPRG